MIVGVCDHIRFPGRVHDARVFRNSKLYKRLTDLEHPLLSEDSHLIGKYINLNLYQSFQNLLIVTGDCAYPLMCNLMTPFRDNGQLPESHTNYNQTISSIRSTIERALED